MRPKCAGSILAAVVAFAPAASAADWYVDASYANCSSSTGSASQPFCTIGAALAVASSGDTVHVASGTYVEQLTVDHSITIDGTSGAATTLVSGGGRFRTITISSGPTVTMSGLSIVHGAERQCGGVFVDVGATLTLMDCVLNQDVALDATFGEGAAVQVNQSTLVAERCTFAGNQSFHNGGAAGVLSGTATFLDCDFHDNNAQSVNFGNEAGGAIDISGGSTVDIERTTFTNNAAVYAMFGSTAAKGGAIHGDGFTAIDCAFTGNDAAGGYGGAVEGFGSTLQRCTFDTNSSSFGGAIHGSCTATACRFTSNHTDGTTWGGFGGAVQLEGSDLTDCTFERNSAQTGGAIDVAGTATKTSSIVRCRIAGNTTDFPIGGSHGGGVNVRDYVTITDSEIVGNEAHGNNGVAGNGGGIVTQATNVFALTGCTVAGNRCTFTGTHTTGGDGGGIYMIGTVCDLDHCVVAGNVAANPTLAQEISGTVNSLGWNDFGSTAGATIGGPGTNDLLDVDPLYADPTNGDFRLSSLSPCIDSGDPARAPAGPDVAATPRFLDGDLDRVQILDRGAHEFCNVALSLTGSLTPGGTVTLAADGTAGLAVLVVVGVGTAELDVKPFGALFVDLAQPFTLIGFGTIPNAQTYVLSTSLPVPATFDLQAAAFRGSAGNFSNLVEVTIH